MAVEGWIYVLHFSRPLGGEGRAGAQHYVGWAKNVANRVGDHNLGRGAAITAAAVAQGSILEVVHTRRGTRDDERIMHNQGHLARFCYHCRAAHLEMQRERTNRSRRRMKERAA